MLRGHGSFKEEGSSFSQGETGKKIGNTRANSPKALSKRNIFLVTTLETIHRMQT